MAPHFITIEGPIGIGKTSLAQTISKQFGFFYLKEIVEENPFLDRFYQNMDEWAFQTEMFFLCNRYKQLHDMQKKYLSLDKSVVADYNIFKNLLFARRTLSQPELDKYLRIYEILTVDMPSPTLVIYMNASVPTLMQRIAKRGRPFEKSIQTSYMEDLRTSYIEFFAHFQNRHPEISVLEIDGDQLDFIERESDLQHILQQIDQFLIQPTP